MRIVNDKDYSKISDNAKEISELGIEDEPVLNTLISFFTYKRKLYLRKHNKKQQKLLHPGMRTSREFYKSMSTQQSGFMEKTMTSYSSKHQYTEPNNQDVMMVTLPNV